MGKTLNEMEIAEIATLILLVDENSKRCTTLDDLKFRYSRASWCDDLDPKIQNERDRKITRYFHNAMSSKRFSASRLKILEWDEHIDGIRFGPKADDFLTKACDILGVSFNASPKEGRIALKRWVKKFGNSA